MKDLAQRRARLHPASVVASLAGHLLVLVGLALLPRAMRSAEIAYIPVEVVQDTGASGAAGGLAASSGTAGGEAAPAPSALASAGPPAEEAAAAAVPPDPPAPDAPQAAPPSPRAKPVILSPPIPRPAARQAATVAGPDRTPPATRQQDEPAMTGLAGGEGDEGAAPPGAAAGPGRGAEGAGPGRFGADEGPGDEYLEKLRRWLARHKKYPEEARRLKQEGTVSVSFVLARDGTVLEARIEAGSGFPALDQAVMDMLERASPVPPVPDAYPGARLEIVMPIRFSIGFFGRLF